MMCKCVNWCRVFDTENIGKYPISNHHPNCDEYRLEEFIVVEHDGARCVMEPREVEAMLTDYSEEYTMSSVMLTRDQFDRLNEFNGF